MKSKIKTIYLSKVFDDPEQKKAFVAEMNLRFNVIKNLMETLKIQIENPDRDKGEEVSNIICAFNLMMHLDKFVEEMKIIIRETNE